MRSRRGTGFALVILGGVWIILTNRGTRHSTLGLVAGCLLILAGLFRVWSSRGTTEV